MVAIHLAALLTCIPCVMLVYAMANAQLDELVWEADAAEAAAEQIGFDFAVAAAATTRSSSAPSRSPSRNPTSRRPTASPTSSPSTEAMTCQSIFGVGNDTPCAVEACVLDPASVDCRAAIVAYCNTAPGAEELEICLDFSDETFTAPFRHPPAPAALLHDEQHCGVDGQPSGKPTRKRILEVVSECRARQLGEQVKDRLKQSGREAKPSQEVDKVGEIDPASTARATCRYLLSLYSDACLAEEAPNRDEADTCAYLFVLIVDTCAPAAPTRADTGGDTGGDSDTGDDGRSDDGGRSDGEGGNEDADEVDLADIMSEVVTGGGRRARR